MDKFILLSKVAGVTFDNEDGMNRQTILKEFDKTTRYINCRISPCKFINKFGIREPAAKVFENSTNIQIGWIPKDMLHLIDMTKDEIVTGQIVLFNDTYGVRLFKVLPSTNTVTEQNVNTATSEQ